MLESLKKKKKKNKANKFKIYMQSPYQYTPGTTLEQSDALLELLQGHHSNSTKRTHLATPFAEFVVCINATNELLADKKAAILFICYEDVSPKLVFEHLLKQAFFQNIPVAALSKGASETLSILLRYKSVSAFAIPKNLESSIIKELSDIICSDECLDFNPHNLYRAKVKLIPSNKS